MDMLIRNSFRIVSRGVGNLNLNPNLQFRLLPILQYIPISRLPLMHIH